MVFTDGAETTQTDQSPENQAQETSPQESYEQKLVEAKGDNWSNPETLAKGKLEADGYIKTLEEQLALMREDIQKKDYQAQVLEQYLHFRPGVSFCFEGFNGLQDSK